MQLGASIWGFFHQQDPAHWPSLAEAVDSVLAIDQTLGVEVWGSRSLDEGMVAGEARVDLAASCAKAAFTTVHIQGQHWSWNPAHLRAEIDFAHQLGAETLVLHPACFGLEHEDDRPDWPEITRIAEYGAKFGVQLVVENIFDSIWCLDRILEAVGDDPESSNIGICMDVGHAWMSTDAGREPVCNYIERYAGQLRHLHLHDNAGDRDAHLLPGHGTIDWPKVARIIQHVGFAGTAVLEAHQEGVLPREGVKQGIDSLKDMVPF